MLAHMKNNIALTAEQRLRGSRVLQALANPLRLEIMQALTESSLTCSELQTLLGCPQSTLSLQLKMLVDQGLVSTMREGTVKHCSIRNREFLKLFTCLQRHLTEVL
jgi:DNA-binding transcriptional ArsR family regulator